MSIILQYKGGYIIVAALYMPLQSLTMSNTLYFSLFSTYLFVNMHKSFTVCHFCLFVYTLSRKCNILLYINVQNQGIPPGDRKFIIFTTLHYFTLSVKHYVSVNDIYPIYIFFLCAYLLYYINIYFNDLNY